MDIRDANPSDAAAACEVLRRSISELCVADHGNDPTFLQRWLSNKTPAIVTSWIQQSDNSLLASGRALLHPGGRVGDGCRRDHPELRGPRGLVSGRKPQFARRARSASCPARQSVLQRIQHRNRASLLSDRRLCRRRGAGAKIRHGVGLSDVQESRRLKFLFDVVSAQAQARQRVGMRADSCAITASPDRHECADPQPIAR